MSYGLGGGMKEYFIHTGPLGTKVIPLPGLSDN